MLHPNAAFGRNRCRIRRGGQSSSYSVVSTADDECEYDDDDSGFGQIRRGGAFAP